MEQYIIKGGKPLQGEVVISGAKNAALPLICASLLTEQPVVLKNTPQLSDITFLNSLLEYMGLKISVADVDCGGYKSKTYTYKADEIKELVAPYDFVRKMRASYYVLGPLLTRFKHVEFSLPGGCAIGARPIDIHLSSLEQMGASIEIKNGYVIADAPKGLKGAHIIFSKASVGATCNILMAATLAKGVTKIENAAKEPEITDLIDLLNSMGAKIFGRGTSILIICDSTSTNSIFLLEISVCASLSFSLKSYALHHDISSLYNIPVTLFSIFTKAPYGFIFSTVPTYSFPFFKEESVSESLIVFSAFSTES